MTKGRAIMSLPRESDVAKPSSRSGFRVRQDKRSSPAELGPQTWPRQMCARRAKGEGFEPPKGCSQEANGLCERLLEPDPDKRLGSNGQAVEVKSHVWFRGAPRGGSPRRCCLTILRWAGVG